MQTPETDKHTLKKNVRPIQNFFPPSPEKYTKSADKYTDRFKDAESLGRSVVSSLNLRPTKDVHFIFLLKH